MNVSFRGKAILTRLSPKVVDGKIIQGADTFEVRIMSIAEGYAMVRRKSAMPFVCNIKDLREL